LSKSLAVCEEINSITTTFHAHLIRHTKHVCTHTHTAFVQSLERACESFRKTENYMRDKMEFRGPLETSGVI